MAPSRIRITGARITPIAFVDPPLLNTVGVHQPYALRAIIQLDTDAGLVGLGETYADETHLARLHAAADAITGLDVFALNAIRAAIADRLAGDSRAVGTAGMITTASAVDQVLSPFEVACLDVQGHATGRPVSDLLGGTVRDAVPFSAYLFYKWAATPAQSPTRSARPSTPTASSRRPGASSTNTASPQSNSRAASSLPRRRWRRSRHCTRPSPTTLCDWTRTRHGRRRRRSRWRPVLQASSSTWRTRRRGSTGWPRSHAGADAAGHQHVRRRVRPARPRRRERLGAGGAFRPSLLGRPAALTPAGRHLRDLRTRAVDALQLPHGYQPRRHGAPRGRHAESHLRMRHALAVEDRGDRQAGCARVRRRLGGRADDAGSRGRTRRGFARRADTSSTCAAVSATATTPAT